MDKPTDTNEVCPEQDTTNTQSIIHIRQEENVKSDVLNSNIPGDDLATTGTETVHQTSELNRIDNNDQESNFHKEGSSCPTSQLQTNTESRMVQNTCSSHVQSSMPPMNQRYPGYSAYGVYPPFPSQHQSMHIPGHKIQQYPRFPGPPYNENHPFPLLPDVNTQVQLPYHPYYFPSPVQTNDNVQPSVSNDVPVSIPGDAKSSGPQGPLPHTSSTASGPQSETLRPFPPYPATAYYPYPPPMYYPPQFYGNFPSPHPQNGPGMESQGITAGSQCRGQTIVDMIYHDPSATPDRHSGANEPAQIEIVDEHRIFIENASKKTPAECIENFLEAKTDLTIQSIVPGGRTGSFLLTFEEKPDIGHIQSLFMKRAIDDSWLKVSRVMKSPCVKVTSLSPGTTEDNISFYFMNKRKSNGGDIRHVKMSEDCTSALVFFYDPAVAERVCARKHNINEKDVLVDLFHECLECGIETPQKATVTGDSNSGQHSKTGKNLSSSMTSQQGQCQNFMSGASSPPPKQTETGNTSEPNISKDTNPRTVMVTQLDSYIAHFLWKSGIYQKQLLKYVHDSCSGHARFIPQPYNNVSLLVDFTGADTGYVMWKKTIESEIVEYVREILKLTVLTINVPEKELSKVNNTIKSILEKSSQLVNSFIGQNPSEIIICGEVGKVDTLKHEIFKVIRASEQVSVRKETCDLRPHQMHYLLLIKFAERFPEVKIRLDSSTNQATFDGPDDKVVCAKMQCLQIAHDLVKDDVKFKSQETMNLFDSSRTSEFIHQRLENVSCAWECMVNDCKVRVYAESEATLTEARNILENSISEVYIPLDSNTEKILVKAEWTEKKRELLEMHKGRLELVKKKRNLVIVSTSDVVDDVKNEVEQFLKTHCFRNMTVPLDGPVARFLRSFRTSGIHKLEEKLQKFQVKIFFEEGIVCDEIKVSGYGDGCTEAEKILLDMVSKVHCKQHHINLPGIEEFFVRGKGRELLVAIEQNEKCVIKPKDTSNASMKKEIKRWDVPGGGTLYVVLGDMRDLKVDAIVNAANKDLQHAGGVAKAIVDRGGKDIQKESDRYIKKNGQLSDGQAVCTAAGKLPCKVIIHAVGPVWSGGEQGEDRVLKDTVKNILDVAQKNKLFSVAIPAISTGIFGYPLESAVKTIMESLLNHWQPDSDDTTLKEVCLCDIKKETVDLFVDVGGKLFGQDDANDSGDNEEEQDDDVSEDECVLKEESPNTRHSISGSDTESDIDTAAESTEGSLYSEIDDSPGIKIVKKELSAMKADVLVNPAPCDLDLSVGAVSRSLLKAAGDQLQEECNSKYEEGILHGEVAVTKGGNLQCRAVFHCLLMKWNQGRGKAEKILGNLVQNCLREADSRGFKSVAFPALGTGKQSFPADISAGLMFKEARNFLEGNSGSSVQTVYFVIHPDDRAILKAFKEKENPVDDDFLYTSSSSSPQYRPRSSRRQRTFTASHATGSSSYQLGSVSVDIVQGDITTESTGCVVNSCRESCDLSYSAVSKALSRAAGTVLQRECTATRSDMMKYGFILTSSGNLQCKMVAHVKVQTSNWGWISVLNKCMDRLNRKNITSMSIPALGTGGMKQSPDKMAGVIYDSIKKFGSKNRHPQLRQVRVVIFQEDMVNTFRSVFVHRSDRSHSSTHDGKHKGSHRRSKHSGRKSPDDDVIDISNKHIDDSVTLCIYTDDKKTIDSAKSRITRLCKEEFDHKELSKTWNTFIQNLRNKEVTSLYRIADESGVALTKTPSGLALTGQLRLVSAAHDKIIEKLLGLQKTARMQEEAKTLAKLVEWTYIDDKGHSTLFTPGLNCRLEKAKNDKVKQLDIEDNKGRKYTVDLEKMVEYSEDGGQPFTIRRVEKGGTSGLGTYVEGEKEALAGTKTVYIPLVPERNFKGTAEDLHFRVAESQFYRLLSGHSKQYKVSKVEYVVNPKLVKQFRSAQEALKKSRGEMLAQSVLAFHGTDVGNIPKICENGFLKPGDPGYQMKSGNALGPGVYFSEYPEYSMGYIKGATKLLLCKVLPGKTCPGVVQGDYDATATSGGVLVIPDTSRILPCYIVHYSQSTGAVQLM